MEHILTTDTPGLLALARDSQGRSAGPSEACLEALDADGIHLLAQRFLHNGTEWRCLWLIKLAGQEEPGVLLMDNGFDAFHLVGSDSARDTFDVSRTESALGVEFMSGFDTRPVGER